MLAHAALALSLTVRVYDAYGVSPSTLAKARGVLARILDDADVHVTWQPCPCSDVVGPAELVIRIAAAPPVADPAQLGFSYVDVESKAGTLATVYGDRVR